MGSRFACIALPSLRIEIARASLQGEAPGAPLAVVVARPRGSVQKETDLLGNTCLDEVSSEARAHGVRRGQTIASARAKLASLRVRVVEMNAVTGALARVAEAALAFGATTAFDIATDVVWVDITGSSHLFGGEPALAAKLGACISELGHSVRVAVADGPRVAAAVAKHAPARRTGPFVVPPGKNAAAMGVLPLSALPLDDESIAWLSLVGMKRARDLQSLPRRSLGTRLGAQAAVVMALLEGDDAAPLTPYRPPPIPEERADLEYGISSTDALLFVSKMLCDRMALRLQGRAMAASRLELVLSLDRAMLSLVEHVEHDTPTAPFVTLAISLPAPIVRAADLFAVLRARVDSYSMATAPILAVTLRVPELASCEARALDLFVAEAKADAVLPRLTAELVAELGESSVGVLELRDTWIADERSRLVPHVRRSKGSTALHARSLITMTSRSASAPEPSRFLPAPVPIAREDMTEAKLVVRFEAVEWWRRGTFACDVVAGWMESEHAVAWIEIERRSMRPHLRGWMD
jgi:nucleotidyltransferase/DNA polymerase involved in DNA repair